MARVTQTGNTFVYAFGHGAVPEIRISGTAETHTVFKLVASFPRAGWTQVRFVNGATSYVLFHYFNLGNYVRNYDGASEESGLLVFQNGHKLSARLCNTGQGLEDGSDLASLPIDPEDRSNDIINDAERHH
ncbi:hypothetical protein KZX46_01990 (plasmid) [Polymorphobacter sp. PAMC 29334]|uniref:hypothetical protein n=1 Tax=Polymorphobacter sp. PAMC 29334 TaxID=2862331 RepID=UPI001C785ADE|nr:hypothetical protein [Polymorphobacter sp. PAMC 29334]QYE32945.1 hypothetical protein KZX46_01990 [Polymorphobacter sp. PAMC 29334]